MALHNQFFDPFFGLVPSAPSSHLIEGEPKHGLQTAPKIPVLSNVLPITGQGTISTVSTAKHLLEFTVETAASNTAAEKRSLHLMVGEKEIALYFRINGGDRQDIKPPLLKILSDDYKLTPGGLETIYWLSLDKENGVLRYGKHFTTKALTLAEVTLKTLDKEGVMQWDDAPRFQWLEKLKTVSVVQEQETTSQDLPVAIHPLPVTVDLSPFVVSGDYVSLCDLASGLVTVPANLPDACQKLYGNIGGISITLDDKEFPDFGRAIESSCTDPSGWCYKKLQEKQKEFGDKPNIAMTYLRITLGYNLGDSPGQPFVLEIWPSGHYSPVHDHGKACAVIKVLYGEIEATYYNSLRTPSQIGSQPAILKKGQITWLDPENYQIHMLHNTSPGVCCTIQCYRYPDQDNVHYEGFNYADDQGEVKLFRPNSDMSFIDFRRTMVDEWNSREGSKLL